MSIWSRIAKVISSLAAGEGLSSVFDRLRGPPERSVAFTIAVIALGAKMAKADGRVTRNEVAAFREVFHIAPEDEVQAARVFDLARQDIAGFDVYARRIRRMFLPGSRVLDDLMEGLFHIALADGDLHPNEEGFLAHVATIFSIDEKRFRLMRARFAGGVDADPYDILGVAPDTSLEDVRKAWQAQVRETHPDAVTARGLPEEAVKLAGRRLAVLNQAWDQIQQGAG